MSGGVSLDGTPALWDKAAKIWQSGSAITFIAAANDAAPIIKITKIMSQKLGLSIGAAPVAASIIPKASSVLNDTKANTPIIFL